MMFLFKEFYLKREDRKQFINITTDGFDTIFLPCPYFGSNIIIHRTDSLRLHKLGNVKVKAWIINKNHNIWMPAFDILLAHFHITKNSR